jgi:zinc protease
VWPGVRAYSADEPALDFLSFILSSGRTSRLQSNLIYGKEIAQQVGAFSGTNEIGGLFQIQATARPGKSLDDIEKEIDAEIARIKTTPPTAEEMARALNSIESDTIFGLQTVLGKASQMTTYAGYLGKPNWFQADLDRYLTVTPADVQRVANTYLSPNRLVMTYTPRTGAAPRGQRASDRTTTAPTNGKNDETIIAAQTAKLPKPGADPKFTLPPIEKTKLSNGMDVWMVQQNELPIVSMNMVFRTGSANEPENKTGVASVTSQLLDDGTTTRSAADIANQLQSIGANVGSASGWDSTTVSLQTLTKNVDKALDIYSDIVQNPSFPATELESQRGRLLVGLRQQKSNPNAISNIVYNKVLYGTHPYGRSNTEASIRPSRATILWRTTVRHTGRTTQP